LEQIRKSGSPIGLTRMPSTRLTGSTNSCRGTGDCPTLQSGSLTLVAISHVFVINYAAEMLGEDEEWLWEIQNETFRREDQPRRGDSLFFREADAGDQ
jgi:hypothetical protein